ncbi:unnamed protein product, partial [Polarella glacialis]
MSWQRAMPQGYAPSAVAAALELLADLELERAEDASQNGASVPCLNPEEWDPFADPADSMDQGRVEHQIAGRHAERRQTRSAWASFASSSGTAGRRRRQPSHDHEELSGAVKTTTVQSAEEFLSEVDAAEESGDHEASPLRVVEEQDSGVSRRRFFELGVASTQEFDAPAGTLGSRDDPGTWGAQGFVAQLLQRGSPGQLEAVSLHSVVGRLVAANYCWSECTCRARMLPAKHCLDPNLHKLVDPTSQSSSGSKPELGRPSRTDWSRRPFPFEAGAAGGGDPPAPVEGR